MAAVVPPVIVAFVLAAMASVWFRYEETLEARETRWDRVVANTSAALGRPLWYYDIETAEVVLDAMLVNPEVRGVAVVGRDGDVTLTAGTTFARDPAVEGSVRQALAFTDPYGERQDLGTLWVRFAPKSLTATALQAVRSDALLLAAFLVAMLASAALAYRRIIDRRLRALRDAMRSGEADFAVAETGKDELGEVMRAYTDLIGRMNAAQWEILEARNEADAARRRAEAANAAKSAFLANMSHEIRTPMNAVLGLAHLLGREDLSARQRDQVAKIHAAGSSLLGVINDILDFSKIEAGKLELETQEFTLESVFDHVTSVTALRAEEKGLAFLIRAEPSVPRVLRGDGARLGQMLLNLANNAIKFTERGEVVVSVDLVEREPEQAWVCFAVRDTGPGLPQEEQARLFQPFVQADNSTTRRVGGTGLGLAICRQFAELMGGTIGVDSAPGAGSTFHFTVPLGVAESAAQTPAEAAPERAGLAGLQVLLVEDNEINEEIACELLAAAGVAVRVARNGREAVDAVLAPGAAFDLVLMDVQMPVLDGLDATREIRAAPDGAALPIIAMTAHAMAHERQRCLDAGMDDHLSKPVDPDTLLDILERWRQRREAPSPTGTGETAARVRSDQAESPDR